MRTVINSIVPAKGLALAFAIAIAGLAGSAIAPAEAETRAVSAGDRVGAVARARGEVAAFTAQERRALADGSGVLFRDTIMTGDETRAEIAFIDDSALTLGDRSRLTIDEMVYDPAGASTAVLTLSQGVFRMVSGQVNKVPDGTLVLHTPVATIGVRGTDFWGLQDQDSLTLVLIDDGVLDVTNGRETVTLTEPLTGVVIERGAAGVQRIRITPEQLAEAAQTVAW